MNSRKIPRELENPIDNIIIDIADILNPFFYKLKFTPNILTSISLILGIISILLIHRKKYYLGSVIFFISYMFDCFDGNMARRYNMVSDFGDLYDHISDLIKVIFFLYIIFSSEDINVTKKKILIYIVFTFGILMLWHLGCQEKQYKNQKNSSKSVLNNFEFLCKKKSYIKISKYFGCGSLVLILSFYIIYLSTS